MSGEPAGPGAPPGEVLSAAVLDGLREVGGDDLVRDLMATFAENTPERLRSAEDAFAAGDLEGTAAALHSLRSASGTVGAGFLADLASRLERAARGQGDQDLAAGLKELRRHANAALAEASRLSRKERD